MIACMTDLPLPARLRGASAFLLVRVMRSGHRRANELFKGEKLRLMHYAAAAYIAEYRGISQKDLSELFMMDASDTGALVQDLVAAGYVERQKSPADRRRLELVVTAAGEAWLAVRDSQADAFEAQFLAQLTAAERIELRRLLHKLL